MINERYVLKKKLGKGRSSVYLCEDVDKLNAEYAIKILPNQTSEDEKNFFRNEFITLNYLNHPNIIRTFDYGTILRNNPTDESAPDIENGSKFFTLEFFEGKELLNFEIKDEAALRKIITQICAALYYLHQSKYIYYDLKPENILVKNINGEPFAKLIDLGFAERISSVKMEEIRGTAEYIAPELLKKLPHDHRVDLYSLGIMLYRIIYDKFPFDTSDELKVYKAQIENEFDFGECHYSDELINITKKLLEKEPEQRYQSVVELLYDLNGKIDNNISIYWDSAPFFSDRKDFLNILDKYLSDENSDEIFAIKGFEGSGKSSLMSEVHYRNKNSIIIKNDRTTTGYNFLNKFLRTLVFNENTFAKFDNNTLGMLDSFLEGKSENPKEDFNTIVSKVARECEVIIILDDFNLYDQLSLGFIKDIIPIFQVGKQKIILTENSEYDYQTTHIYNLIELNLNPFTEVQLNEFLDDRFADFFPKGDLKKVISLYSDFLPGNIGEFIKDLLRLNIIQFNKDSIKVIATQEHDDILRSSHEKIYENRIKELTENELKASQILSLFNVKINADLLSHLLGKKTQDTIAILENLKSNNILQQTTDNQFLQFTSENLKEFIYSEIHDKKSLHLQAANLIAQEKQKQDSELTQSKQNNINFDNRELARQYELAGEYDKCYEIIIIESAEAERLSAYSYQKDILLYLLNLNLEESKSLVVKRNLVKVYYSIGDYATSLKYIDEIIDLISDEELKTDLIILKGSCFVLSGEISEGKQLLSENLNRIKDDRRRIKTLIEIAYAELDLGNFEEAANVGNKIINDPNSTEEDKGRCFNLLGLINIQRKNDFDAALVQFESALSSYEKAKLPLKISTMEMNIGNIYYFKRDYNNAKKNWDESLQLNAKIGNLEQEALLYTNVGNFFYNIELKIDSAIEHYNRALSIFKSLENDDGQSMTLFDMSEPYLLICEYEKAFSLAHESMVLSQNIENLNRVVESMFLLSKICLQIGDYDNARLYHNQLKKLIEQQSNERGKNHYKFLNILLNFSAAEISDILKECEDVRNTYLQQEDTFHFFECSIFQIKILIDNKKNSEAINLINEKDFDSVSKINILFETEKKYFMALIAENDQSLVNENPLEIYMNCLKNLEDFHITDVTWRTFYRMGLYHYERGKINQSIENFNYVKQIMNMVTENFKSEDNKRLYLSRNEISGCTQKIQEIENTINK